MNDHEDEKQAFEKWQQDRGLGRSLARKDDGYADPTTNAEWHGWRRRAFLGRQRGLDEKPPLEAS